MCVRVGAVAVVQLNKSLTKCDEWVQLCVDIKKGRADEEEIRWRGRDCVIRAGDWRRVLTNSKFGGGCWWC